MSVSGICPQRLCGPKGILPPKICYKWCTCWAKQQLRSKRIWEVLNVGAQNQMKQTKRNTYILYIHLSYIVIYSLYDAKNKELFLKFRNKKQKTKMPCQNPLKWFQATFRDGWCGNRIETCQVFSNYSRAILWEIKVHTPNSCTPLNYLESSPTDIWLWYFDVLSTKICL